GGPMREPMDDIKAVKWLPLKQAVEILTRAHEKVFLANVGPVALKAARQSARDKCIKPYLYNNGKRRGPSMRVAPTKPLRLWERSSTGEDAGGINGIHELARAGLGLADIVDDHVRPQLAVRELDAAHSMRDARIARARARRKAGLEHLARRGDQHRHHIGVA